MSNSTLTPEEILRKKVLEALQKVPPAERLEFLYSITSDALCPRCGRVMEFEIEPLISCDECSEL